eukprot:jgi/Galph1/2795/GphlegSOOS_G1442.1
MEDLTPRLRFLTGVACNTSTDCSAELECLNNVCVHLKFGQPFTLRVGLACLVFFVASAMASAGGIGGGPIFVPVLEVMLNFAVSQAGGISQSMITGMAVGVSSVAFFRRHPERDRPAVYYEVVTSMVPLCLMGTFVGTYVNQVLPGYFTAFIVVIILIYLVISTAIKAVKLRRIEIHEREVRQTGRSSDFDMANVLVSESQEIQQDRDDDLSRVRKDQARDAPTGLKITNETTTEEENQRELASPSRGHKKKTWKGKSSSSERNHGEDFFSDIEIHEDSNIMPAMHIARFLAKLPLVGAYLYPPKATPNIDVMLQTERKSFQWGDLLLLFCTWSFVIIFTVLRGGKPRLTSPLGVELCGWAYWFLLAVLELVLLIVSSVTMLRLYSLHQLRVRLGYEFCHSDIRWVPKNIFIYSVFCFVAGLVASWVGISVETLAAGFLLVVLGIDPLVVQLTGGVINLFTSSAIAVEAASNGSLAWRFALFYAAFGFLGSLVGVLVIGYFVQKYHVKSIIVFCLVCFLFIATGLELYIAIETLLDTLKYESNRFPIGSIC